MIYTYEKPKEAHHNANQNDDDHIHPPENSYRDKDNKIEWLRKLSTNIIIKDFYNS